MFYIVDTEPPAFENCNEVQYINLYTTLNDIVVVVTDNNGIASLTANTNLRLPAVMDINVTFTAQDFANPANEAECMIIVIVTSKICSITITFLQDNVIFSLPNTCTMY